MDIIHACISLVPVPYLCLAFSIFKSLFATIQGVQWSEQQLRGLAISVAEVLRVLDGEIRNGSLTEHQISTEMDVFQT